MESRTAAIVGILAGLAAIVVARFAVLDALTWMAGSASLALRIPVGGGALLVGAVVGVSGIGAIASGIATLRGAPRTPHNP